tara:strand:+ start:1083 stop:1982 length:900 start_codon:yes stop_codon:yes gene_type:complete
MDFPNKRSSHCLAKPTGGGLAIMVSSLLIVLAYILFYSVYDSPEVEFNRILYIPLICIPLGLVGLIDDAIYVKQKYRYIAQLLTSIILIYNGNLINTIILPSNHLLLIIFGLFVLISSTAVINIVNFMDGLDGLLSGCILVIFIALSFTYDNNLIPFVGAILAFLSWNWEPSKIFMGDSGSTFLGAFLSGIIFNCNSISEVSYIILMSSPLLLDGGICIIRRMLNGQNIFKAHNLHLFQRLYQKGWNHSLVSLLYMSSILLIAISYQFFGINGEIVTALFVMIIGFLLDFYVATPFENS